MLAVKRGNILSVKEGMILQQVNAQGVMGSGIAKSIRELYPEVFPKYKNRLDFLKKLGHEVMGELIVYQPAPGLYIGNMVGQRTYGRDKDVRYTSYDALDEALQAVKAFATEVGNLHIHYPTFGCGLGNGNWSVVQCLIQQHIGEFEQTLWLQ